MKAIQANCLLVKGVEEGIYDHEGLKKKDYQKKKKD